MSVFRINADHNGLRCRDARPVGAALDRWLSASTPGAPVTIMVHGYRYAPGVQGHDPHDLIYAETAVSSHQRAVSWPLHLSRGDTKAPIIAFGWPARGNLWRAAGEADQAGRALAALVGRLARAGRQVRFICHSLGAQAVLTAISELPGSSVEQAILMVPAVATSKTRSAIASPAGQTCRFLNVTTHENLVFDLTFRALSGMLERTIAQGLRDAPCNWVDLRIDHVRSRRRLAALGYPIAAPARKVCHWSPYLRAGMFPIYRAFLAGRLSPAILKSVMAG